MKQLEGRVGIHTIREESVEELIAKIEAISEGRAFKSVSTESLV